MTYQAPDFTSDDSTTYKSKIDGNFALLSNAAMLSGPLASNAGKALGVDPGGSSLGYFAVASLLGSSTSKSVAGSSNVNLTAAEAAKPVLILTGALTGDIDVTVPAAAGCWTVWNNTSGDFAVTFKPLGGSGVVLDRGQRSIVKMFSDGSAMRELSRLQVVVGSVDIDMSLTGAQAVTGLAGRPAAGIFFGSVASQGGQMSLALWDGSNARLIADRNTVGAGTWTTGVGSTGLAYYSVGDGTNQAYGTVAAAADGFTITRSKAGSPSGTFVLNYMLYIS